MGRPVVDCGGVLVGLIAAIHSKSVGGAGECVARPSPSELSRPAESLGPWSGGIVSPRCTRRARIDCGSRGRVAGIEDVAELASRPKVPKPPNRAALAANRYFKLNEIIIIYVY